MRAGNSRLPQFTRTNSLNIYLYEAASGSIVKQWLNHPNPKDRAGVLRYQVNDTWWGDRGAGWNGQNRNFLYYWVATAPEADPKVQGIPQPIFTAVRKYNITFSLPTFLGLTWKYYRDNTRRLCGRVHVLSGCSLVVICCSSIPVLPLCSIFTFICLSRRSLNLNQHRPGPYRQRPRWERRLYIPSLGHRRDCRVGCTGTPCLGHPDIFHSPAYPQQPYSLESQLDGLGLPDDGERTNRAYASVATTGWCGGRWSRRAGLTTGNFARRARRSVHNVAGE